MMGNLAYALLGAGFGVVLYKSEVISWFRIQEMFRFQGFHMYGVMMTAVLTGALFLAAIKRRGLRTAAGESITVHRKPLNRGTWLGGALFGMGWALTGACPGPLYALVGGGVPVMWAAIATAVLGAWVYALLRPKLPH